MKCSVCGAEIDQRTGKCTFCGFKGEDFQREEGKTSDWYAKNSKQEKKRSREKQIIYEKSVRKSQQLGKDENVHNGNKIEQKKEQKKLNISGDLLVSLFVFIVVLGSAIFLKLEEEGKLNFVDRKEIVNEIEHCYDTKEYRQLSNIVNEYELEFQEDDKVYAEYKDMREIFMEYAKFYDYKSQLFNQQKLAEEHVGGELSFEDAFRQKSDTLSLIEEVIKSTITWMDMTDGMEEWSDRNKEIYDEWDKEIQVFLQSEFCLSEDEIEKLTFGTEDTYGSQEGRIIRLSKDAGDRITQRGGN